MMYLFAAAIPPESVEVIFVEDCSSGGAARWVRAWGTTLGRLHMVEAPMRLDARPPLSEPIPRRPLFCNVQ